MDIENLLTGTKWDIIQLLSKRQYSPLELSKQLNTTIANISQQLRLLETADLIKKNKTGSTGPGKPRTLFSLSDDYAFITIISQGFAQKKLIHLTKKTKGEIQKIIS